VKVKELLLDYKPVPTGSERFFLTQEVREDLSLPANAAKKKEKKWTWTQPHSQGL
jgi:hypothetical protein